MHVSKMCRSCIKKIPKNELKTFNRLTLDKFVFCTNIQVFGDDELPKKFCEQCTTQINVCYNYILHAQEINQILRKLIEENRVLKENYRDYDNDEESSACEATDDENSTDYELKKEIERLKEKEPTLVITRVTDPSEVSDKSRTETSNNNKIENDASRKSRGVFLELKQQPKAETDPLATINELEDETSNREDTAESSKTCQKLQSTKSKEVFHEYSSKVVSEKSVKHQPKVETDPLATCSNLEDETENREKDTPKSSKTCTKKQSTKSKDVSHELRSKAVLEKSVKYQPKVETDPLAITSELIDETENTEIDPPKSSITCTKKLSIISKEISHELRSKAVLEKSVKHQPKMEIDPLATSSELIDEIENRDIDTPKSSKTCTKKQSIKSKDISLELRSKAVLEKSVKHPPKMDIDLLEISCELKHKTEKREDRLKSSKICLSKQSIKPKNVCHQFSSNAVVEKSVNHKLKAEAHSSATSSELEAETSKIEDTAKRSKTGLINQNIKLINVFHEFSSKDENAPNQLKAETKPLPSNSRLVLDKTKTTEKETPRSFTTPTKQQTSLSKDVFHKSSSKAKTEKSVKFQPKLENCPIATSSQLVDETQNREKDTPNSSKSYTKKENTKSKDVFHEFISKEISEKSVKYQPKEENDTLKTENKVVDKTKNRERDTPISSKICTKKQSTKPKNVVHKLSTKAVSEEKSVKHLPKKKTGSLSTSSHDETEKPKIIETKDNKRLRTSIKGEIIRDILQCQPIFKHKDEISKLDRGKKYPYNENISTNESTTSKKCIVTIKLIEKPNVTDQAISVSQPTLVFKSNPNQRSSLNSESPSTTFDNSLPFKQRTSKPKSELTSIPAPTPPANQNLGPLTKPPLIVRSKTSQCSLTTQSSKPVQTTQLFNGSFSTTKPIPSSKCIQITSVQIIKPADRPTPPASPSILSEESFPISQVSPRYLSTPPPTDKSVTTPLASSISPPLSICSPPSESPASNRASLIKSSPINNPSPPVKEKAPSKVRGKKPTSKKYVCDVCGRQFNWKKVLQMHELTHSDHRAFICAHCNSAFKMRHVLIVHLRTKHQGKRPYLCDMCAKRFKTLATLQDHKVTHAATKMLRCPKCTYETRHKSALRRHNQLRHEDAKNHVCTECKKQYNSKDTLKRHMRIHTGERPYKCPKCPLSFIDHWKRKLHLINLHKMKFDEIPPLNCEGKVTTVTTL